MAVTPVLRDEAWQERWRESRIVMLELQERGAS
jgi:hypothetical protein